MPAQCGNLQFFCTQILREINFGNSIPAILNFLMTQNLQILGIVNNFKRGISQKIKIHGLQNGQKCSFRAPKIAKFDYT